MKNIPSELLRQLPNESILDLVPELKHELIQIASLKIFKGDQVIAHEGKKLDGLYIPIDRELRLVSDSPEAHEGFNGHLLPGRSLALKKLLLDLPIPYRCIAEGNTKVLFIPKSDFFRCLNRNPRAKIYLLFVTQFSVLRSFKSYLESYSLPQDASLDLFSKIKYVDNPKIDAMKRFLGQGLIFVEKGSLDIESNKEASFNFSHRIIEGQWFGGEALVPPHLLSYHLVSSQSSRILFLPFIDIKKIQLPSELVGALYNETFIDLEERAVEKTKPVKFELSLGETIREKRLSELELELDLSKLKTSSLVGHSFAVSIFNIGIIFEENLDFDDLSSFFKAQLNITPHIICEVLELADFCTSVRTVSNQKTFDDLSFPCVVFYRDRLVVAYRHVENEVTIIDPGKGLICVDDQVLASLELQWIQVSKPSKALERHEKKFSQSVKSYLKDTSQNISKVYLIEFLLRRKKLLIQSILLATIVFALELIPPWMSGKIIDEVLSTRDLISLRSLLFGLFICYFSIASISYVRDTFVVQFSHLFDHDYSSFFYRRLLKLGSKYFSDKQVGDVFARLGELQILRSFVSKDTAGVIISLISVVVYSGILIFYSWKIALVPFAMTLILVLLQIFFRRRMRVKNLQLFDRKKELKSLVAEAINLISTIKSFSGERYVSQKYEKELVENIQIQRDLGLEGSYLGACLRFFSQATRVIGIWISVLLLFDGKLTAGAVFAINLYLSRLVRPLTHLADFVINLEEVRISLLKLNEVLLPAEKEVQESKGRSFGLKIRGKIRIEGVHFKYDTSNDWVLQNISFTAFPRQIIAIVGQSGCGKTTLGKLISGALSPSEGQIFYDGIEQSYIDKTFLNTQVKFTHGTSDLFSGTIASNVAYADSHPDRDRILNVCKETHSMEFIDRFPSGIDQFLAEGGLGLSGGQKQCLSLARMLYQDPKVVIMDEATAALDTKTEAYIVENFKRLFRGRTAIMIAHRLSTIRYADEILVLDKGHIVESGTHYDLVRKQGHYFKMFRNQI